MNKGAGTRKKQILIAAVACLLGGLALLSEYRENARMVQDGILRGSDSEETRQEEFSYETDDGRSGKVSLEVSGRVLTAEETAQILDEAREEWEEHFLGDNASAKEVCYDLALPDTLKDGKVSVNYQFDNYEWIDIGGKVHSEDLSEEGTLVELTAEFTCGDHSLLDIRTIRLVPPILTPEEAADRMIRKAVVKTEAETREEPYVRLPQEVDGHQIFWKRESAKSGLLVVLAGVLGAWAYGCREKENEKKKRKLRRQKLLLEYPHMVEQFSMLLGSGMTVPGAWEQILRTGLRLNPGRQVLYLEEMQLTLREMKEGSGVGESLERFGNRTELAEYRRFASILSQNLQKGTRDVKQQLQTEARSALETRRTNAKRLGEEAGTKLLGPMMCMFVIVLAVVLYPALRSF